MRFLPRRAALCRSPLSISWRGAGGEAPSPVSRRGGGGEAPSAVSPSPRVERGLGGEVLFLLLLPTLAFAADTAPTALAAVGPPLFQTTNVPGHVGHQHLTRIGTLDLGPVTYSISYCVCADKAHAPQVAPLEGYIGMPGPHADNWYHSGFLFIILNGQDIGPVPLSSMAAAETGKRAIVDMVWHHEISDVRVRFVGLPGEDRLYCEIALEPKQEIKTLEIRMNCYPSFFTAAYGRNGARRIKTPATLILQDKQATLPAAESWWACYYDEVFDIANNEGDGPCAMMFAPEDADKINFNCGNYGVTTAISYKPTARKLRFAFWDFVKRTNADVLATMPASAAQARRYLASADFTPIGYTGFDGTKSLAEVETMLHKPRVRELLGAKVAGIEKWIADSRPLLTDPTVQRSIAGQEKMAVTLDTYNNFVWDVKLAELFDY